MLKLFKIIGSPPPNRDLEMIRKRVRQSLARDRDRFGGGRQLGAILKSGDRTKELHRITAPTLVIHGDSDKLINTSGGRATAKAIPGARLVINRGQGHDLGRPWWPKLLDEIGGHIRAAEGERGQSEPAAAVEGSAG
jgi:pimeloyl-ACP methyl ester carboxylesterase